MNEKAMSPLGGAVSGSQVQGAQVIDRALSIVAYVADHDREGARLADVACGCRLTSPTAHRLLRSLESHGYIERSREDGLYRLGATIAGLGYVALYRHGIEQAAWPSLANLANQSGDTALFTIRRGWHSLCLGKAEGDFPIRSHVLQPGDRHPLGVSSGGLAILATLPDAEVQECLAAIERELSADFPAYSPRSLLDQVAEVRETGFALNPGHIVAESFGLAVAVPEGGGPSRAALTVAGIESRILGKRRPQLEDLLHREARELESRIRRSR